MLKQKKGTFCNVPLKMIEGFPPMRQTVFSWLCFHADKKMRCFPSIELLCQECGSKRTAVIEAIKYLEGVGYLKKKRRRNASTIYQIIIKDMEIKVTNSDDDKKLSTEDSGSPLNGHPEDLGSPFNGPRKSVKRTLTILTELNPLKDTHPDFSKTEKLGCLSLFDFFWKAYPVKRSKEAANKIFNKLKIDEILLQEILESIKLQKEERKNSKEKKELVPAWMNPGTWLKN